MRKSCLFACAAVLSLVSATAARADSQAPEPVAKTTALEPGGGQYPSDAFMAALALTVQAALVRLAPRATSQTKPQTATVGGH